MSQQLHKHSADPFDLDRFVRAQQPVYDRVTLELRQGRKTSHWMWFIFPQIAGLGSSEMAQKFAIASADEARAYLAHPVLGPRLKECTRLVNEIWRDGRRYSINEIFGYPDDLKFKSSMTLFGEVAGQDSEFRESLEIYFRGQTDKQTLVRL